MCFVAFTFLNYLRNKVKTLSERQIIKTLDRMQMSAIQSGGDSEEMVYMRSKINDNQTVISKNRSAKGYQFAKIYKSLLYIQK